MTGTVGTNVSEPPRLEPRTLVPPHWPERQPDLSDDVWTWLVPVGELRV